MLLVKANFSLFSYSFYLVLEINLWKLNWKTEWWTTIIRVPPFLREKNVWWSTITFRNHQSSETFSYQRKLSPWLDQNSNCPTILSSTEQRNIAWCYSDIKQVLLQKHTFQGSFRTEFLLNQSDINQISKDTFGEWLNGLDFE